MEILEIVKWPGVFLLCFLLFIIFFYKPIKTKILEINKVTRKDTGISFAPEQVTSKDKSEKVEEGVVESNIFSLKLFTEGAKKRIDGIISKESGIESIDSLEEKYKALYGYTKLIFILNSARIVYLRIFGSQLRILQQLHSMESATKESLKMFYDAAKNAWPDTYKDYTYEQYLNFLVVNDLIVLKGENEVALAPFGQDLLTFIHISKLAVDKGY
jgi:hypothetical protein